MQTRGNISAEPHSRSPVSDSCYIVKIGVFSVRSQMTCSMVSEMCLLMCDNIS